MHPRFIVVTDALPKTETEKIKRHELKRLLPAAVDIRNSGEANRAT